MSKSNHPDNKLANKKLREHVLIGLLIAVPVLFAVYFYVDNITERDEEKTALFLTIYFLLGVYAGRSLAIMWLVKNKLIPQKTIVGLLGVILVCLIVLLFVGEMAMRHNGLHLQLLVLGLPFLILAVAIGMTIKFVRHSIKEQLFEARATAEQSQSELKFLQTQLSPHFLFNTLNNMYGLSLTQHEKIPALLLKLSSLLRYSVYDARELFVPLKNEMAYINDYIEFEKIRIGDRLELQTFFEEPVDPNLHIAPLLLIVFIENAFKHAKNSTNQKIYIHITLKTWGNSVLFAVKNSSSNNNEKGIMDTHSGFGLDNVHKRLELLYKDKYDLQVEQEDGFYHVLLNLKVK